MERHWAGVVGGVCSVLEPKPKSPVLASAGKGKIGEDSQW